MSTSRLAVLADASIPLEDLGGEIEFQFIEGPVWIDDRLFFSDVAAGVRYTWDDARGLSVVNGSTNKGNGMDVDAQGRLVVCEQGISSVTRFGEPASNQGREILASHWRGMELNSPNDVICAPDGSVYFTDPVYGRTNARVGVVRDLQLPFRAVFRIAPDPDPAAPELLVDDFDGPNGLCLSPDGTLLYVNDTPRQHIRVFTVADGGRLVDGRTFVEGVTGDRPGFLDGMECDERGNVWVTGPGGIWVFAPDGSLIGTLDVPEVTGSLAWGGRDFDELFICASRKLYRMRTHVRGNRFFG